MIPVVLAVYSSLLRSCRASVDDILVDPVLRERFLSLTRQVLGDIPESDLLRCLINLRKRSRLPRVGDILSDVAA